MDRFIYEINLSDQNFIEAIISYNAEVDILSVNQVKQKQILKCKDLHFIIQGLDASCTKLSLVCQTPIGASLNDILPSIPDDMLACSNHNLSRESLNKIDAERVMIQNVLRENLNERSRFHEFQQNGKMLGYTIAGSLKGKEAAALLNLVRHRTEIAKDIIDRLKRTLHIKPLAIILFQYHHRLFFLSYHDPLAYSFSDEATSDLAECPAHYRIKDYSLTQYAPNELSYCRPLEPISFNLNEGFSVAYHNRAPSNTPEEQKIVEVLQTFFIKWKYKHYVGPLIPLAEAGFKPGDLGTDDDEIKILSRLFAQWERTSKGSSPINYMITGHIASFFKEKEAGKDAFSLSKDYYNRPPNKMLSITKGAELGNKLRNLSKDRFVALLTNKETKLNKIISNVQDLWATLFYLYEYQYEFFFSSIKRKDSTIIQKYFIQDGFNLHYLLKHLTVEQCQKVLLFNTTEVMEIINDKISKKNKTFIAEILRNLSTAKIKVFLNVLKIYLVETFNMSGAFNVFEHLNPSTQKLIIDALRPSLPVLIQDLESLTHIFANLSLLDAEKIVPPIRRLLKSIMLYGDTTFGPTNKTRFLIAIEKIRGNKLDDIEKAIFNLVFNSAHYVPEPKPKLCAMF